MCRVQTLVAGFTMNYCYIIMYICIIFCLKRKYVFGWIQDFFVSDSSSSLTVNKNVSVIRRFFIDEKYRKAYYGFYLGFYRIKKIRFQLTLFHGYLK